MKILVTDGFILWNFIFVRISIIFGPLIGRFYPQTIKRIKSIFIVERISFHPFRILLVRKRILIQIVKRPSQI